MRQKIAIVDYGMGNMHSVAKALSYVSPNDYFEMAEDPDALDSADRIVFPGVGAIRDCMNVLKKRELDEAIRRNVKEKPLLGICVGMQALYGDNAEHKGEVGLKMLAGEVRSLAQAIPATKELKIPHIGWNNVHFEPSLLWENIEQDSRFYFLHGYYCQTADKSASVAHCDYGIRFNAAVQKDNIFAVQFHPEKSHKNGLQLLANFTKWEGA